MADLPKGCYVINRTKKQYYSRDDVKPFEVKFGDGTADNWQINPLPLLTCEGNGRGGGDYRSDDCGSLVGTWARDLIEITADEKAIALIKADGYTEIHPDFKE